MQVIVATGKLLDEILSESYRIWGEGLTRDAYERYNTAQTRTNWGRDHLQRLALMDDGRLLASAKKYELHARLDGRLMRVLGIGAVFTPASMRRRGYARALLDQMLADAATEGIDLAMLFSEIGPAFYERFGFSVVPIDVVTLAVERRGGAPMVGVRSGEDRDLPVIADMQAMRSLPYRFCLVRDPDHIQHGIRRKRLLAGLGPRGLRSVEFFVAEEGGRAAAYVVVTAGPTGWMLEEAGDRDPNGARIGAILQTLLARTPTGTAPRLRGWLPGDFRPPQLGIVTRKPSRELMMLRALQPALHLDPPLGRDEILYWHADAF